MPNFGFNPADASAGFPVYPGGTYEITIGEPKSYFFEGKNGKQDTHGVGFMSKISGAEDSKYLGKKFMLRCPQHDSGMQDMSKPIQMSALGFNPKDQDQEQEFDAKARELDWSYNTDDGSCGSGWHEMTRQVVVVDLDVKIDNDGEKRQSQKNWRPLGG